MMTASGSNEPTIPLSQAMTAPVPDEARPTLAHLPAGAMVSRYRVVSVLGEGGMGTVYLARQEKPDREVALKVVRPGYATERMLRRFELEAEVLGRLLHPGIAQIYEAGVFTSPHADEKGGESSNRRAEPPTPFFAMELVKGVPLTTYAEEKKLGTRERLELVAKVCDAVQHAHQKGVIHRDLKPGNILVVDEVAEWQRGEAAKWEGGNSGPARAGHHAANSSVGQPKILDFGVARATDSDLQQTTVQTDVGAIIGTIPYMSPEQVGGDPSELDTRSDVYALGVIAYELLVGRLPYSLERKMIHEAARIIREDEPTRLSTIDRTLRGDVETIVAHALEKDKARRYGAASALAADIRRYLSDEPIAARPASTWYQLAKFSRRNTALVGGVAATFIVLIAGIAATSVALKRESEQRALAQANETRANEEKSRAESEAERAKRAEAEEKKRADELKQVSDFQESMLAQIDPTEAGYRLQADLNAKFEAALEKAGVPEAERGAMADTFRSGLHRVNLTDAARELIDRTILKPAVDAIDRQFKDQPLVDAQLRQVLAKQYLNFGLIERARPLQVSALQTRTQLLGPDHVLSVNSRTNLGALHKAAGDLEAAERCFREAVDACRGALADDPRQLVSVLNNLGYLLEARGHHEEAEGYLREALALGREVLDAEDPTISRALNNLGLLYVSMSRFEEAEACFREAADGFSRKVGDDHPDTLHAIAGLGSVLMSLGNLSEAEGVCRRSFESTRRVRGEAHPDTIVALIDLGVVLDLRGTAQEAEECLRTALALGDRVMGQDHPDTLAAAHKLGVLLRKSSRLEEAALLLGRALDARRRTLGPDHRDTLSSISSVGFLEFTREGPGAAEPYFRELVDGRRRALGEDHPDTIEATRNLGFVLQKLGRSAEAEPYSREVMDRRRRLLGDMHPETLRAVHDTCAALVSLGRFVEAEELLIAPLWRLPERHAARTPLTSSLVALYTAWHKRDPLDGHDAKAAEWKAKLDALASPQPPAAAPAPPPSEVPATSAEPK